MIKIKVIQDTDPESPRSWDNLGVMVCWHRRYKLGDQQPTQEPHEWFKEVPDDSVVLPLYLMDHSGISISTGSFGDPWDSGQIGWIFATPEAIRNNFSITDITADVVTRVEECLKSEVKVYDLFLTGDVWGYTVESVKDCESCGHEIVGDEVNDSCWGFFGDDLDFTGMKEHIDPKLHADLEAAWENRLAEDIK